MCKKKMWKSPSGRIDKCMRNVISSLGAYGFKTVACCCGHGKYPMTIIYRGKFGGVFDLFSGKQIKRKRKFYKRDKRGYYFIPEVQDARA